MQSTGSSSHISGEPDPELDRLVEELIQRFQAGELLHFDEIARDYPHYADRLQQLWPSLTALTAMGQRESSADTPDGSNVPHVSLCNQKIGDFRILREVGCGGMGVVYEAVQVSLARRVAVKILHSSGRLDDRQIQRFRNEAIAAGSLQHPNIVPVYSVGSDEGVQYYAMQFISGQTLSDIISLRRQDQPLQIENKPGRDATQASVVLDRAGIRKAADQCIQVAQAVHHAHQLGIVHRDLKPSNILVDEQGKVWVTDFGLARMERSDGLTESGELLGTLRYMSPEQLEGSLAARGHSVDIYGLGATLYEMLTLRPVFEDRSRSELIRKITHFAPTPPRRLNSRISRDLETIVLKSLEKNPVDRYDSALAMAEDLQSFLDGRTVMAKRPTVVKIASKWASRNVPALALSFSALLIIAIVASLASIFVWQSNQATLAALQSARKETRSAQLRTAQMALERGNSMCDSGDVGRGLIWFAYALRICPADETDLPRVIRSQINIWKKQFPNLELILEHPGSALMALFNHDGTRIVTSAQSCLWVWDAHSGELLRKIEIDDPKLGPVRTAMHPRANIVAVGDYHGKIHVFDFDTGERVCEPKRLPHPNRDEIEINRVAFSFDGELLLGSAMNGDVRLWTLRSNEPIGKPMNHAAQIASLGFSPDGKFAITACRDRFIRRWSIPDGEMLEALGKVDDTDYWEFAWLDRGNKLVLAGSNNFGAELELSTKKLMEHRYQHLAGVCSVSAHANSSLIASSSWDQTAQLWDSTTAARVGSRLYHEAYVPHIQFAPDGMRFATTCDKSVRVWRVNDTRMRVPQLEELPSLADIKYQLLGEGEQVIANNSGDLGIWSTQTGRLLKIIERHVEHFDVSSNGAKLICVTPLEVMAFQVPSGELLWKRNAGISRQAKLASGVKPKVRVHASPSGDVGILSRRADWEVVDLRNGNTIQQLTKAETESTIFSITNDHRFVAAVHSVWNVQVEVWDIASNKLAFAPLTLDRSICALSFANMGNELRIQTSGATTKFWDMNAQKDSRQRTKIPASLFEVCFSPNENHLLGASFEGSAQFFDVLSGARIGPIITHFGRAQDVSFTSNGRLVATCGPSHELRFWHAPDIEMGTPQEITRRVELLTGITLNEEDQIEHLNVEQWNTRR